MENVIPAENFKIEDMPKTKKYYQLCVRYKDQPWISAIPNQNLENVISDRNQYYKDYDEYLIISFDLPF